MYKTLNIIYIFETNVHIKKKMKQLNVFSFKLIGEPLVPVFVAPAVTPWRYVIPSGTGPAHNPAIRLVKYDRQTGRQLDILQVRNQYYSQSQRLHCMSITA
jgi:hypothetical protein